MAPDASVEVLPVAAVYWGLRKPGCPLCRAARLAEIRQMNWFLLESNYAEPMLARLQADRFCMRHAGMLFDERNRHLSGTFHFLQQGELRRMRSFRADLWRRPRGLLSRWRDVRRLPDAVRLPGQPDGCPACDAGRGSAEVEAQDLIGALATEAGRAAYRDHDGLCRPHLWLVLRDAPPESAAWLAEETERRLEALGEAFELYFHRLDYRFQHEPKGEERSAWRRGLRYFWGDVTLNGPPPAGTEGSEAAD